MKPHLEDFILIIVILVSLSLFGQLLALAIK